MATLIPKPASEAEATFMLHMRLEKLPLPTPEHRFSPPRKWRFDFAWPDRMFAVEVEGVTRDGGRHQRIDGFQKDLEKYEAALLLGWTVYRCSPAMVKSGRAAEVVKMILERDGDNAER